MKITIPFTCTAEVLPPRCRIPRLVPQETSVTLSFREVTGEEAPVAILEREGRKITRYRWFNRRLWTRARFQRSCRDPYETQTAKKFLADPYPYSPQTWALCDLARVSLEVAKSRLRDWARSILFIDGERWEAASEPRYVVMTFGLGHNHGLGWGTSLTTDHHYNPNIARTAYFRIDQHDQAVRAAEAVARGRGDTKALPIERQGYPRFEILIPDAVRLRPHRQHGKGDPFMNRCEEMIQASGSAGAAGLAVLAQVGALL